jgi:hypothetical protein
MLTNCKRYVEETKKVHDNYSLYHLIYAVPETNLRSIVPDSYIYVSVSNLYIPRIGLPIWLQHNRQTDHGNTVYKSLMDT